MRLVVAAAMLVTLVAGCTGAQPQPPHPLPRFATSIQLFEASNAQGLADKTSSFSMTYTIDPSDGESVTTTVDGSMRIETAGLSAQMTVRIPGAQFGLVVLPDKAYVKHPKAGPRPWLPVDPNSSSRVHQAAGAMVEEMRNRVAQMQSPAPHAEASTIVDSVPEQLDGVWTMRYEIHTDMADVARLATDPTLKQRAQDAVELSGGSVVENVIWMDEQNRVLRTVIEQEVGELGSYRFDIRSWDFGIPVEINAPPPVK